jgi:hypothetical protein
MDVDPMRILRKLTRSSNEQVQLRAVDLLLSLKKEEQSAPQEQTSQLLRYASLEQLDDLQFHCRSIRALKQQIRDYIAAGGSPREPDTQGPQDAASEPVPSEAVAGPAGDAGPIDASPDAHSTAPSDDEAGSPVSIPDESEYRALGLLRLRGRWTHPDGDAVALAIMSGTMSAHDARALVDQRAARTRALDNFIYQQQES